MQRLFSCIILDIGDKTLYRKWDIPIFLQRFLSLTVALLLQYCGFCLIQRPFLIWRCLSYIRLVCSFSYHLYKGSGFIQRLLSCTRFDLGDEPLYRNWDIPNSIHSRLSYTEALRNGFKCASHSILGPSYRRIFFYTAYFSYKVVGRSAASWHGRYVQSRIVQGAINQCSIPRPFSKESDL